MPTLNASNGHHVKPWIYVVIGLVAPLVFACSTGSPDLEENVDDGPALNNDNPNEAGIHLRQVYAWNNPEQARSDLASLVFTDGGDRSA
jgi:hypothetical protein